MLLFALDISVSFQEKAFVITADYLEDSDKGSEAFIVIKCGDKVLIFNDKNETETKPFFEKITANIS